MAKPAKHRGRLRVMGKKCWLLGWTRGRERGRKGGGAVGGEVGGARWRLEMGTLKAGTCSHAVEPRYS